MIRKIAFYFCLVILTGCSFTPRYERPALPVTKEYPVAPADLGQGSKTADQITWKEFFKDPRLQQLIEIALKNNRDYKIAALQVQELRAENRLLSNALLPSIEIDADSVHQRSFLTETKDYSRSSKYTAVIATSYELDFFGKIRNLKDQILEQYFASEENRRSVEITLIAQVAVEYFSEQSLSEQLSLLQSSLKSQEQWYALVNKSYDLGTISELDKQNALLQLESLRILVEQLEREKAQATHRLVFILGQPLPTDLPISHSLATQEFLTEIPAGLPADLLNHRPDIMAAEHALKAANYNVGSVRADFFPQISLTGEAGFSSVKLTDLLGAGKDIWNFSPQLTLPIFNRKNNAANLDIAKIQKEIEIAQYEKTIQNAFREVADALVGRATLKRQLASSLALVKAQEERLKLIRKRFEKGIDDYFSVLNAQLQHDEAQRSLTEARFLTLANSVSLYKALGGGADIISKVNVKTTSAPATKTKINKTPQAKIKTPSKRKK